MKVTIVGRDIEAIQPLLAVLVKYILQSVTNFWCPHCHKVE